MHCRAMADSALFLGVDWFPEQWPRARWARDLELMKDCGLRVVRIAEFTWSKTQPAPGRWEWAWLDDAVAAITAAGLRCIVCTPSACPTPWMIRQDPSILPVVNGKLRGLGHRRHYSPHHAAYRAAAADIAGRISARYATNPGVIGFQIDNELVGNMDDHGPLAKAGFARWLAARHGDLTTLDQRLGLVFWGQQYDAWDDVPVPSDSTFHPGLRLEFARFSSQAWIAFCRAQADAMRPHLRPGQVLTTNCYLPYWGMIMDWVALQRDGGIDLLAIDNYARCAADGAWFNDLARSISPGHWILEQQCGSTMGQHMWPDRQGRIAEDTGIAVAKGARVITYFRWRQGLYGNEQDHGAILDHHGDPGPIYAEVQQCARTLRAPALPQPRVGVAFSWDAQRMWSTRWPDLEYEQELRLRLGAAAHEHGIDLRFCFTPADAGQVDQLLLPLACVHDPAWESAMTSLVARGGTVVGFPLLFAKDTWGAYREDYLSPAMEELFGIDVRRRIPLRPDLDTGFPGPHPVRCDIGGVPVVAGLYVEELEVLGASVLGRYVDGPLPGGPSLTVKRHPGGGRALWCGCYPDATGMGVLLESLAQ